MYGRIGRQKMLAEIYKECGSIFGKGNTPMTDKQIIIDEIKLHGNRKDLTGLKVGKLTCLKPVKTGKNKNSEWLCECECGNFKIAQTYRLLSGRIQSCGDCYHTINHYIPMIKELEKQLTAKKQECEELKNFHINLVGVKECEIKELLKLKQTLAEIKPILEYYANSKVGEEQPDKTYKIMLSGGYIMAYDPKPAREGLKKISECEVE